MNNILSRVECHFALVYLSDIEIFRRDLDKNQPTSVGGALIVVECGVKLNVKKCVSFSNEVDYIGHVRIAGDISLASHLKDTIQVLHTLKFITQPKFFVSLTNLYSRFVPEIARMASALNRTLNKPQHKALNILTEKRLSALAISKANLLPHQL